MVAAVALALAFALDRMFGEPRSAWHPVAWFGRALAPLGERIAQLSPASAFLGGVVAWSLSVVGVVVVAAGLESQLRTCPAWLAVPVLALALKPAFAWRMLGDEVRAVEAALERSDVCGRERLARLCSRDVAQLDSTAIRETAIESLAENFNDSLVAPLFWFVVAGLPGAWAWRAINTLDAMWGYRGRWEWAGKWAARADDALGFVPARLAAAALWSPAVSPSALAREARRTPSPNGGWPMATMALRLRVRLTKPGVYVLNGDGGRAAAAAVRGALAIADRGALVVLVVAIAALSTRAGLAP